MDARVAYPQHIAAAVGAFHPLFIESPYEARTSATAFTIAACRPAFC